MKGEVVYVDDVPKIKSFCRIVGNKVIPSSEPILYDMDPRLIMLRRTNRKEYERYVNCLVSRGLFELLIDPASYSFETIRAITDFIPVYLDTARLRHAVDKLLSTVEEQQKEIDELKRQIRK